MPVRNSWHLCVIAGIEREQDKIKRDAKEAARKGEKAVVKAMAKNIVMSNKGIERMHVTKANLNSVLVTLQTQGGELMTIGFYAAGQKIALLPRMWETVRVR